MASSRMAKRIQSTIHSRMLELGWINGEHEITATEVLTKMVIRGADPQSIAREVGSLVDVGKDDAAVVTFAQWLLELPHSIATTQQLQEISQAPSASPYSSWDDDATTSKQPGWSERNRMTSGTEESAEPPEKTKQIPVPPRTYIPGVGPPLASLFPPLSTQPTGRSGPRLPARQPHKQRHPIQGSRSNNNANAPQNDGRTRAAIPATPIRSNLATARLNALPFRRAGDPYPQAQPGISWETRPTYTKPAHTRETFEIGDIISRPFHAPNMRAQTKREDDYITEVGLYNFLKVNSAPTFCHVYTKRRMFVIIFKHARTMFCLPLYSYRGRGFDAIDRSQWNEHVGIRDTLIRDDFKPHGWHRPIGFVHMAGERKLALSVHTTIDLVSGTTMSWEEEGIEPVGRITKAGYDRLISYWNEVVKTAQKEQPKIAWDPADDWESPAMMYERFGRGYKIERIEAQTQRRHPGRLPIH